MLTDSRDLAPPSWLGPLASALDDILWVTDSGGDRVIHGNAAFQRFWGLAPPAAVQAMLAQIEHAHRERVATQWRLNHEHGGAGEFEYRVQPAVGAPAPTPRQRSLWLRERTLPADTPGLPAGLRIHLARDVTWQFDTTAQLRAEISRRNDAERNLDDANARLRALIDTANDAVVTIDEDSRIIDWNHTAQRMFGWTRAEAMQRTLTDLIVPPRHRQSHHRGLSHYLRSGEAPIFNRRVETTALRRDGEEFDVELSVWPVRTGDRHTFSSFIRDISRRKSAERALGESEAKYRAVVENVNEGILVTADGRILYANPRALVLAGVDDETARARPFIEFIHPDDRAMVLDRHVRRLRGESVENHYQFRVRHRDGQVLWLEISAVLFEWQGREATLNFLTDVTLRRQVENEVREALQRERELSELKSRFVAVTSHELRTPLAAILSSVELLDDYAERLPADERREMLGMIKNAVARMNGMVEQVMLTSRLESGAFSFSPLPCRVAQLLIGIAAEIDRAHPQAARIAMDCQALDEPRMIDEQLLRHILVNLLVNALKYSPPDSPVHCGLRGEGEQLLLQVSDQGIGIPAADRPRLFQSFHRGANVGNVQGTGMGLYIVAECVRLHGGTIEVASEPGRGTRFLVHLHAPVA